VRNLKKGIVLIILFFVVLFGPLIAHSGGNNISTETKVDTRTDNRNNIDFGDSTSYGGLDTVQPLKLDGVITNAPNQVYDPNRYEPWAPENKKVLSREHIEAISRQCTCRKTLAQARQSSDKCEEISDKVIMEVAFAYQLPDKPESVEIFSWSNRPRDMSDVWQIGHIKASTLEPVSQTCIVYNSLEVALREGNINNALVFVKKNTVTRSEQEGSGIAGGVNTGVGNLLHLFGIALGASAASGNSILYGSDGPDVILVSYNKIAHSVPAPPDDKSAQKETTTIQASTAPEEKIKEKVAEKEELIAIEEVPPTLFDTNSFEVKDTLTETNVSGQLENARTIARWIAEDLTKSGPKDYYVCAGYADKRNENIPNLVLSQNRAKAACSMYGKMLIDEFKVSRDVVLNKLVFMAAGEDSPITNPNDLQKNRAVYLFKSKIISKI